jgi:site-specific recombinase XerD
MITLVLIRVTEGVTSMTGKEIVPYTEAVAVTEVSTDDTLVETWLHGLPESTQRAYRREIRDLLDYTGKHLQDITIFDLQAYETDKLMSKANTSRARAIASIKSLYKRLRQSGLIDVNPAEFLRMPKITETLAERYLTPEQVDSIIAQAKSERDRIMMSLMYFTGMRVSEVVSLTWNKVQSTPMGATLAVKGKGDKTRYIHIDEEMMRELKALDTRGGVGCCFPSGKTGDCMTTTQAQRIVVAAAEKAGIDASPHFFRHAHASHLFNAGVQGPEIRDELGHANIATTNKYAHSVGGKALGSILRHK